MSQCTARNDAHGIILRFLNSQRTSMLHVIGEVSFPMHATYLLWITQLFTKSVLSHGAVSFISEANSHQSHIPSHRLYALVITVENKEMPLLLLLSTPSYLLYCASYLLTTTIPNAGVNQTTTTVANSPSFYKIASLPLALVIFAIMYFMVLCSPCDR